MEWGQIIALIGALGGWEAIKYFMNRKSNAKIEQARAESETAAAAAAVAKSRSEYDEVFNKRIDQLVTQMEHMNSQIEFKDKRIAALNSQIAEKEAIIERKDKAYSEQTNRLRKVQDQLAETNGANVNLTKRIGELELRLSQHECVVLNCIHRDPPNEFTKKALAAARNKNVAP